MKKIILIFIISHVLVSCSKSGSSNSNLKAIANSPSVNLSSNELETKKELQNSLKSLQDGNYKIDDTELEALVSEGLLTQEELNSLIIIQ